MSKFGHIMMNMSLQGEAENLIASEASYSDQIEIEILLFSGNAQGAFSKYG